MIHNSMEWISHLKHFTGKGLPSTVSTGNHQVIVEKGVANHDSSEPITILIWEYKNNYVKLCIFYSLFKYFKEKLFPHKKQVNHLLWHFGSEEFLTPRLYNEVKTASKSSKEKLEVTDTVDTTAVNSFLWISIVAEMPVLVTMSKTTLFNCIHLRTF